MITRIEIKGFKSLNNAVVDFYASKNIADKNKQVTRKHKLKTNDFKYTFNLAGIVGANATGKTSFLNAVYFYKDIVTNQFKLDEKKEKVLLYSLEKQEKEFTFEYLIENEFLTHKLKLDEKINVLSETLTILKSNNGEQKWETIFMNNKNYSLLWRVAEISEYEEKNYNIFSFEAKYIKFINKIFKEIQEISFFRNNYERHFNHFLFYWKPKLKDSFKNKISKKDRENIALLKTLITAVDPNIIDFIYDEAEDDIFVIIEDIDKKVKVPFQNLSDGTKRCIMLIFPIFLRRKTTNFYLIDEIENSFHPRIVETILSLFYFNENNVNNSQLLFTTHNPYIFDSPKIHNSCINVGLYNTKQNFEKLSNFDEYKRNDKLFSKNYMLEVINSHPDSNNLYELYDKFSDLDKDYESL